MESSPVHLVFSAQLHFLSLALPCPALCPCACAQASGMKKG